MENMANVGRCGRDWFDVEQGETDEDRVIQQGGYQLDEHDEDILDRGAIEDGAKRIVSFGNFG